MCNKVFKITIIYQFVGSKGVEFEGLPPMKKTHLTTQKPSNNNLPIYVKHGFPEVFKKKVDYYDYLPKINQLPGPESEETYGLMYHKPETEAEIKMHDLWIARRRQEVYIYMYVYIYRSRRRQGLNVYT
jgi:hypothetical protein